MKSLCRPFGIVVLLSLACASCGDDPKLVEKREKQKSEITRLRGELALIDEKLKNLPPDVTDDLTAAKKLAEKQGAEVATLEDEIAGLESKKRSLQNEFEAYQLKYQVK